MEYMHRVKLYGTGSVTGYKNRVQVNGTGTWYRYMAQVHGTCIWYRYTVQGTWYMVHGIIKW